MFNISPYIAKYVRGLHANEESFKVPYSHTQFGVVLMVDVVGFSTLTTLAQQKGDSGAEAIAMEIGAYMGECIQIIEFYGGDVVKFLGDAVLVCFQPISDERRDSGETVSGINETEASERQKNMLVRRGIECGLQLLARLSHYRVYLTAEERSKHRTPNGSKKERQKQTIFDAMTPGKSYESANVEEASVQSIDIPKCLDESSHLSIENLMPAFMRRRKKNKTRRLSNASDLSASTSELTDTVDLELHMALSCGNVVNIILGDLDPDVKNPDPSSFPQVRSDVPNASDTKTILDEFFLEYHGRLEYTIGGDVVDSLDEALSIAKAGEMSITPIVYDIVQRQAMKLTFERRRRFFVIKNITEDTALRKNNYTHTSPLRKGSTAVNNNVQFLKTLPGLRTQASKMTIEPLIPRIRNTGQMNLPIESNKLYMKYINRSALYRMQNSVDGNLPAQFREVTIMFVSLGGTDVQKKEGLINVQKAVLMTIKALVKYEGMLQQFAIDDKGATLLSVFGLPPLSHEREAVFAAKAALDIRDSFRQSGFQGFAISLSTGIIFTAVLPQGSPYRRDAGIAGDTIVVAVRMLKFPFSKENVVCDPATKKQIGGLCEFEDYGENFVKGKVKPVHIFGIQKFGPPERDNRISVLSVEHCSDFIGYKFEIETASAFVDDWNEAPNHHTLVVSGPSGVGKSFFCNRLHKTISLHGVLSCWSSSTEVEKGSKYYLLRTLILALFEIIESDKIPVKPMARSDSNSHSTADSSHHGFNRHSRSVADSIESENSSRSLSSASFPTTQEWFKRLTTYSSMTPSSFGSNSNNGELTNDMIELISRCLHKCGEERGYMPLFKLIFTTLNEVEENRYTRLLDGRAKDILLTGVITRMVLHVSKHIGLVFICDDIQWADTTSIHMLQHIHEHCPRVMLLMSTRPIRDYNVTFLKDFKATGTYEEIALNGLGETEIGEIILQNFDRGVNRISPEIVKVIQKRTGGNPLYVKNMAIILKDFDHVTVVEGELLPSSSSFDLEDLMGNFDYKRIIKMQFDRLDSNYQEFLTVASCLDQYFTVHEVEAAIKENNFIFKNNTPEMTQIYIQNLDVYHFLQQIDNGNPLDNITLYSFTHITIPQSIYDMVSYETRTELHRSLAKYYESQLNKENFIQLLGKITRHYLKTDSTGKQLYYLEALADQNMQTYLLPEATSNLQKIVKILEQDSDLLEQFGHIRLSDIYRRLGVCFTMRTKLREGELYLYKALEALGEPWPKQELKFLCKLWANRFKQYQHRKWRVLAKLSALSRREIVYRVVEIMTQLSNIYFYTGNGRDFSYACLVGLNACEKLDDVGPNYTLFLARNALLCWINDEKDSSIYYIAKALRQMGADKSDSDTLTICSLLCFAAGKFSNARDLLYQSIDGSQTLGIVTDCQAFYRSVGLVVTMRIFEGTFNRSATDMALLKQMANTAHSNGDYEAEIWLSVYNIGNAIVIDRMADCSPYVTLLEAHIKNAADYNRIAIHGTLVCYYARNHMYELARRHIQKLVNILPELTVTPNIFPIYGLIFATMGLYCLVEDGQINIGTNDDSKDYEKLIFGLSRLNHAFQQVKFWEFTQPCLYLARALPYVTTRRIVEGYMVLRHGVFEMQFIQEIRFLKAYYWANLGKFAFTPEDRIEWTKRAIKDFEILGIPADTYCNPDPGNYYYRGFQADLCSNVSKHEQETIVQIPAPVASTSKNTKTVPNNTL
ncbi:hypothetical protein MFLAVUS_004581 [Mucor flavus]|uniref:Guanylate cyclase domain-containing protein n=1 Tax=Mucor flavus TaxID=439312 RepID=A0ABP9YWA8_9FUNG